MRLGTIWLIRPAITVLLILLASACGGDAADPSTTTAPTTSSTSTATTTTTRDITGAGDFAISVEGATIAGTLDLPNGPGPHPVVVIVPGSGAVTQADAAFATSLFVPQGVGVFRYDKRGAGDSTGTVASVTAANSKQTLGQRADDVASIVDFLAAHGDVDIIGLMGSSQGGWVVPQVTSRSPEVSFMISVSGAASSVGISDHYERLADDDTLSIEEILPMLDSFEGPHGYDPHDDIAAVTVPSLWVYGGMDRSNPTDRDIMVVESIQAESGHDFTVHRHPFVDHEGIDTRTGALSQDIMPMLLGWVQQVIDG